MRVSNMRVAAMALGVLATTLFSTHTAAAQTIGDINGLVVTQAGASAGVVDVRLVSEAYAIRTDATGTFTFVGLAPGSYLIEVSSQQDGSGFARVTVAAGRTARIEVQLSPSYHLDPVVVTAASPSRRSELARSATVLDTRDLLRSGKATIGETLSAQLGVSSTFFGPGASRPVIRGLGGDRVRILENDLDVGDASSNSPDHAVSIDPFTTDRIEILRGPASLLYGGSAIGGVVNAIDARIAREPVVKPFSAEFRGRGGTVANEVDGGGRLQLASGPLVVHLSGSWLDSEDYDIPAGLVDHDDPAAGPGPAGALENSGVENKRGSVGLSLVNEKGYVGVAFTAFDSFYGVPGHEEPDPAAPPPPPGAEEEFATVDLRQRRYDVSGGYRFDSGFIRRVEARFGLTDYTHDELEGGVIGTTALNDQWDARVAVPHRFNSTVSGSFGVEVGHRKFSKLGEEAFVPPTETDSWGVFGVEDVRAGDVTVQLGARYDRHDVTELTAGTDLNFNSVALSAGVNWLANESVVLAFSATRSEKIPSDEDLFADGAHIAQRTFELGDPTLEEEIATGIEGSARWNAGMVSAEITGFFTHFDNFLFLRNTPDVEDGFPVFDHAQADARFVGLEAEVRAELYHAGETHIGLRAWSDYVRATLTLDDSAIPRIPPFRLGGGIEAESGVLTASLDVRRVFEQGRVASFEESTEGYTMVDASLSYRLFQGRLTQELMLQAENLGDTFAQNHISFLKESAPLQGRELRLVYRVLF